MEVWASPEEVKGGPLFWLGSMRMVLRGRISRAFKMRMASMAEAFRGPSPSELPGIHVDFGESPDMKAGRRPVHGLLGRGRGGCHQGQEGQG